jgi:valyl-tRNA synthetase
VVVEGRGEAGGLPAVYDPRPVEEAIYARWLASGAFRPAEGDRPRFVVVMPPPNVTGELHMGHALDLTLQDVFVRWHRMRGEATLWVPGTDHAGIATHAVVERRLRAEGQTRQALGREAFVRRVWEWKEEYEARIVAQLQRLGCSCDWGRQRFTMDPGLSRAVEEVFVRYYQEGLIYRGQYIVNWCPGCGTAISDLEVDHEEEDSWLYRIRYPVDGGGEVVVATVRPETMLGDTAVAVHPDDGRYRDLVGRRVRLPLVGRWIPVVADAAVDPEFGTGALKVTPAHDATDAAIAARHGLPAVAVVGPDGRMTAEAGRFAGLTVREARDAVVAALEAEGALAGREPYRAPVGRCARCGTVIEPLVSRQWFLRVRPLCDAAAQAVRAGEVRFHPEGFTDMFLQWMEDAHDWCISRQIWWGHRIPAYECARCGEVVVARAAEVPATCPRCGAPALVRDPDVLDTWFSSALWPFSTLGWPDATEDLARFYPTDLLVTGWDILFLWVARMVFSGLHFTGRVPFRDVLLHGLVRDAAGRKMSKSLGNGIDPLEVVGRYGTDALRYALLLGVAPGHDLRLAEERVAGGQRFCNKLWNAARFAQAALAEPAPDGGIGASAPAPEDGWIRTRLGVAAARAEAALRSFDAGQALGALTGFVWDELCDWYLEAVKPRLYGRLGAASQAAARTTLREVLRATLRLLHPFLPFVTEAIWGALFPDDGLLLVAPWPRAEEWPAEEDAARAFERVRQVVGAVRSLRAEMRVPPGAAVRVLLRGAPLDLEQERLVRDLARVSEVAYRAAAGGEAAVSAVLPEGTLVLLPLEGLVDVGREVARLRGERDAARRDLARVEALLADPLFRTRARPEVVAREAARRETLAASLRHLEERLAELDAALGGPEGGGAGLRRG